MKLTLSKVSLVFLIDLPILISAIIWGKRLKNKPYFVWVVTAGQPCGGVIVDSDVVVIAARCMYDLQEVRWASTTNISVVKANFADPDWSTTSRQYPCESFTVHPKFNQFSRKIVTPYDIALVKLREGIDLSKTGNGKIRICPTSGNYSDGVIMGKSILPPFSILRGVYLSRYRSCFFGHSFFHEDEKSVLCYGLDEGMKNNGVTLWDACGPLFHRSLFSGAFQECLVGFASYHYDSDHGYGFGGVSAFSRAACFQEWIEDSIVHLI